MLHLFHSCMWGRSPGLGLAPPADVGIAGACIHEYRKGMLRARLWLRYGEASLCPKSPRCFPQDVCFSR